MAPLQVLQLLSFVVDYISELTIHSVYVHPFCAKEIYNISLIVNKMQQIVQVVGIEGFRNCTIII